MPVAPAALPAACTGGMLEGPAELLPLGDPSRSGVHAHCKPRLCVGMHKSDLKWLMCHSGAGRLDASLLPKQTTPLSRPLLPCPRCTSSSCSHRVEPPPGACGGTERPLQHCAGPNPVAACLLRIRPAVEQRHRAPHCHGNVQLIEEDNSKRGPRGSHRGARQAPPAAGTHAPHTGVVLLARV